MYGKLFTQMYDGTLGTNGPWEALVTFQQLIILADKNGEVDLTIGAVARRTTIPQAIIETGIAELLKPDPESRSPDHDGRRLIPIDDGRNWGWKLVNYAHYRKIRSEDDRREYHRQYAISRRAKAKEMSTPVNTSTSVNSKQPIAVSRSIGNKDQKKEPVRATRLPHDWKPSSELQAWAKAERPDLNIRKEFDSFTDYWRGVGGQRGCKLDWPAAFRNWIRKANGAPGAQVGKPVNTSGPSPKLPEPELKARQREALADQERQFRELGVKP